MFAVLGTFVDFSGDAQTCIAKQHKTRADDVRPHAGDDRPLATGLDRDAGQSPPSEAVGILLALAKKQKTLEGKTVAVLGDTKVSEVVKKAIEPG